MLELNTCGFHYMLNYYNKSDQVKLSSYVTHLLLKKDVEGQNGEKAKISRHAASIGILKGQTETLMTQKSFALLDTTHITAVLCHLSRIHECECSKTHFRFKCLNKRHCFHPHMTDMLL